MLAFGHPSASTPSTSTHPAGAHLAGAGLAGARPLGAPPASTRPGPTGIATARLREADVAAAGPRPVVLDHHLLLLGTAGKGDLEVDFQALTVRPGTLLWIRPGRAVRLVPPPGLDAMIVAWDRGLHPDADLAGLPWGGTFGPVSWQLAGEDEDAIITEMSQLVVDCERFTGGPAATALLRHELAVLLLRIGLLTAPAAVSRAEARTFHRFCEELERHHGSTRRVEVYAARLGCSVRTLTRASLAVTGRTAKQLVDDRVVLTAKRMLGCGEESVAEIGRRLGFAEPTNFGRFFQRAVGVSPGAFRTGAGRTVRSQIPTPRRPSARS